MMCDKCGKNPVTTHIKKVVNGNVEEMHLCAYCAAKGGYGNFGKLSLTNMLASMLGDSVGNLKTTTRRCECCGASFSDIAQSGRVGCSECYTTFKEELLPSLSRLHGKTLHVGSVPDKAEQKQTKVEKIAELKAKLNSAVQNEEYEQAAKFRDEIRAIESEGDNNA